MKTYLVGGAIRDRLLGLRVRERDWLVLGATRKQMLQRGYIQVGKDFPVFLHPQTGEQYALARTERKTGVGYHGFEFQTGPNVSLEEDLQRRDLTINAMAEDADGELSDPWNGRRDLQQKLLRHVSPAFAEDPLRVLRVARFATRFEPLGFTIAAETMELMSQIAASGELTALRPERVWRETMLSLGEDLPEVYFRVLHSCGALQPLFPELDYLAEAFGERDSPARHALLSLRSCAALSREPRLRFAALLHNIDDATAAEQGQQHLSALFVRICSPKAFAQTALLTVRHHRQLVQAGQLSATELLKLLESIDSFRRPERLDELLLIARASLHAASSGPRDCPQLDHLSEMAALCRTVTPAPLMEQGKHGKALGLALHRQRLQLLEHRLQSSQ